MLPPGCGKLLKVRGVWFKIAAAIALSTAVAMALCIF
jgi:hypothetical protein